MVIAVLLNVNLCFGNDSSISSNSATDSTNTETSGTSTTTSTSTTTTTATPKTTTEPIQGYYILLDITIALNGTNFDENELEKNYTKWVYN